MHDDNPILVEVIRGELVESYHRGAAVIMASGGRVVASWGDIDRPIYARSALKPLQALPLVESGAADHYRLSATHLALACASHNSEPRHVQTVAAWLATLGLEADALACGPHLPYHQDTAHGLVCAHESPSRLHNNCSGKHAGMLATARYLGEPVSGYEQPDHPVQQRIFAVLEALCEIPLAGTATGIDGCGIPVLATPLRALGQAFAHLANPVALGSSRRAAVERILQAMTAEPFLVAGSGRFDTALMTAVPTVAVKVGAEGVYTAVLPEQGVAVALKIDDGAARAAEVALGALLQRLGVINSTAQAQLVDFLRPTLHNHGGAVVGSIRPASDWLN